MSSGPSRNAVGDRARDVRRDITLTDEKAATDRPVPRRHRRTLVRGAVPGLARGALPAPPLGRGRSPDRIRDGARRAGKHRLGPETNVFDFIEIDANWKAGVTGAYESMSKVTSGGVQIVVDEHREHPSGLGLGRPLT